MRHVVTQQLNLRKMQTQNQMLNWKKREQAQTIKNTTKRIIKTINNWWHFTYASNKKKNNN